MYSIRNWRKYQHYHGVGEKARRPTWIKLYVELLDAVAQPEYAALPDRAKLTLVHLWLVAAKCSNRIPEAWITARELNMNTKPLLAPLLTARFVEECRFDSRLDSVTASKSDSENAYLYSSDSSLLENQYEFELKPIFESRWNSYPLRDGRKAAYSSFAASVHTKADLARFDAALANYCAHLAANPWKAPKTGATFFSAWSDWVPAQAPECTRADVDDIRDLVRAIDEPEWSREDCTRSEAREYVAAVVADGLLSPDAPSLSSWLMRRSA